MNRILKVAIILVSILSLTSCSSRKIFRGIRKFFEFIWDVIEFIWDCIVWVFVAIRNLFVDEMPEEATSLLDNINDIFNLFA